MAASRSPSLSLSPPLHSLLHTHPQHHLRHLAPSLFFNRARAELYLVARQVLLAVRRSPLIVFQRSSSIAEKLAFDIEVLSDLSSLPFLVSIALARSAPLLLSLISSLSSLRLGRTEKGGGSENGEEGERTG